MFESPSAATRRKANFRERWKQMTGGGMMTGEERECINRIKREKRKMGGGGGVRKKLKAKGPNPLSCKKTKGGS